MCVARRKDNLKYRYGITEEQYDQMLEKQNHTCAICNEKPEKNLAVDHCHTTGEVRGLLCMNCNKGLGMFKEDENRIIKAAEYIKNAECKSSTRFKRKAGSSLVELHDDDGRRQLTNTELKTLRDCIESKPGIGPRIWFACQGVEDILLRSKITTVSGSGDSC